MSNCTNNFIKRVIGVTRTFKWTVTTNGAAVPLVAEDLTLQLVPPRGEAVSLPFDVDDNIVSFTWQGDDQHIIGCYSLILWANYGEDNQRRVDIHNFVELIPWSDRQSGEYSDLVEESIELETADFGENIMVVDNLNSTSATDALSANMGRQLNVTKQDVIQDLATIRSGAAAGAAVKEWAKNDPLITDDATQVSASKLAFNGNIFEQWVPGIASSIGLKGIAGFLKVADISQWDSAYNDRMLPTVAAVKAKLQAVLTALATIEAVIPSQASSTNKLTDKGYVDGAIATNTANFVGTFDTLAELQAVQNPTKNDYGFVIESDAQGNEYYDRYKYTGTQWLFEYKVESTPFTAEQWAAIQSGITAALVSKLSALPTNAELNTALASKQPVINDLTTIRSGAAAGATAYQKPSGGIPKTDLASAVQASLGKADAAAPQATTYTKAEVDAALALKQTSSQLATINGSRIDQGGNVTIVAAEGQTITIDAAPTQGSNNAVSSDGVYNAIEEIKHGGTALNSIIVSSGGHMTFDAITLSQDGDELEIQASYQSTLPAAKGYAFAQYNGNIAVALLPTIIGAKTSSNSWVFGMNAAGSPAGYETNKNLYTGLVVKLKYESGVMNVYVDGSVVHTVSTPPTIMIDTLCGTFSSNYWSGTILKFNYTHNGVTKSVIEFDNFAYTDGVTISSTTTTGMSDIEEDVQDLSNSLDDINTAVLTSSLPSLNDVGTLPSLPTMAQCYFRTDSVNGVVYAGTQNVMQLLGFKQGSVTYNGVTVTISGCHVTISGTNSGGGVINLSNLTGYSDGDNAVAATTIPTLPTSKYYIKLMNATSGSTCYIRSKSASWVATLTNNAPRIEMENGLSTIGAFVVYLINETTYNASYDFVLVPYGAADYSNNAWTNVSSSVAQIIKNGIYYADFVWGSGTATLTKVLPTTNKMTSATRKIAWFGDSISQLGTLPHLVAEKMACTIYDCSFAGAPLTYSTELYQPTGFMSLAAQIAANDFSDLDDALSAQLSQGVITQAQYNEKRANADTLEALDFSKINSIVVFAGTNDLTVSSLTIANLKSGFKGALDALMAAYKNLTVYIITPIYRSDANDARPNNLVLNDIVTAMSETSKECNVPCLDFYHNCSINANNYSHFLSDGLHPNTNGDAMLSTKLNFWLQSI